MGHGGQTVLAARPPPRPRCPQSLGAHGPLICGGNGQTPTWADLSATGQAAVQHLVGSILSATT